MAFPDLQLYDSGRLPAVYHSEAEGVPDNGINEFAHGINPEFIRGHEDELEFHVYSESFLVTNAVLVGLSADLSKVIVNFTQAGAGQARVRAIFIHSPGY